MVAEYRESDRPGNGKEDTGSGSERETNATSCKHELDAQQGDTYCYIYRIETFVIKESVQRTNYLYRIFEIFVAVNLAMSKGVLI